MCVWLHSAVYMAPEVINGQCHSISMDVWAAGVMLYQMLTAQFPFWDTDMAGLFRIHPGLRGYVLDERGNLRRHIALFVDGDALQPKSNFALVVREDAEIYVMQALSGG